MLKLNPKQYIAEYGGKAGGWFYLRDLGGFEENLVPMIAFLGKDEDFSRIADKLPETFPPVIVRGSHPNDYWGLVDIIQTEKNVTTKARVKDAISRIRYLATTRKVSGYNKYEREFYKNKEEWQEYDGKIRMMVQPFISDLRGSMVEHPHKKGTYLIDIVKNVIGNNYVDSVIMEDGILDCSSAFKDISRNESMMAKLVSLYRKVRETGFVPDDHSFQMEFGFSDEWDIYFYQARPFIRFQEPTFTFDAEERWDRYECFGITPEKGLELEVVTARDDPKEVEDIKHPFALALDVDIASMQEYYLQDPDFQPRNMVAFLPVGGRPDNLEHGTYRWVTKADVSILSYETKHFCKRFEISTGSVIRITSNGLDYKLEKV